MPEPRFITLSTGLRIALEEAGDPQGTPVFCLHGWPASRLQGAGWGPAAEELGARIICPDRPGIGLSCFQPGRRLLDWPPVVREIAAQLGLKRFRILAISGGGPYGLATAFALPDLVTAVAVVSGAPPLGPETDLRALRAIYRWLLTLHRRRPQTVRRLFAVARPLAITPPPVWVRAILLRFIPPADRGAMRTDGVLEGSMACFREAWRNHALGVVSDAEVYAENWGFEPEKIQVPVRLWHGKADRSFSWQLAEALAQSLPCCRAFFVEGEGHYSLAINRKRDILRDLLLSGSAADDTSPRMLPIQCGSDMEISTGR